MPRGMGSGSKPGREYADFPMQITLQDDLVMLVEKFFQLQIATSGLRKSLRKEVIQPQVPLRLPCYDLVPVTSLAVGTAELDGDFGHCQLP